MACGKRFTLTKTWQEKGKKITQSIECSCVDDDFVKRLCPECVKSENQELGEEKP